ncbi:MAG: hypothetical protein HYV18_05195 [Gammaproteobacteria bacterium]|nr:hypothetical protein [Gammaproteobacteria bacterium]
MAGLLLAASTAWAGDERADLTLADGRKVQATLRVPPGAGPFPAIMVFGGFRRAARVPELVRTDQPVLVASFDYPFAPPRRFIFPDSLRDLPELRRAIHGTVDGVGRLYAYLRARADVDVARITVVGASVGAPFATVAAAEHGIPGLIVVHGFGRVTAVIARQFQRRYEPRCGAWCRPLAWLLAVLAVAYTDPPAPEDFAARLAPGQRVLMISAAEDSFIPREAADALWRAFDRSDARRERMVLPGDHINPKSERPIGEILALSFGWMRREGLLAPDGG